MAFTRNPKIHPAKQMGLTVALAVFAAALWVGWFAWDTTYQRDRVTGELSGPYEVWQGIGCFLCAVVVVAAATRLLRAAVVIAVMPLAFTAAFALTVVPSDESGLAGVGVILIGLGTLGPAAHDRAGNRRSSARPWCPFRRRAGRPD
ncbi:hypothetical protein GCM10027402_00730 [Arthrobacter monumenti]